MMAPTILKDGPDDGVSVRRKSRLRGLGRHESRQHKASEDRFAFPVVHCVFTLLLDYKTEVSMRKRRNCTFLTHLSMLLGESLAAIFSLPANTVAPPTSASLSCT